MIAALLLLLAAADAAPVVADGEPAEPKAPRRVVGILPLAAEGTVSGKQAKGVTAQLRTATEVLVGEDLLRLLPATKDDDNALRRCGADDECYDDLAKARGADRVATGSVTNSDAGLVVTVHMRPASSSKVLTTTLSGDDGDAGRLDRLARELFAEETLRGSLRIEGQPNDEVVLDGRRRGTLAADDDEGRSGSFVVEKLREGEHQLTVTRPLSKNGTAYDPFSRAVSVRHRETTTVKVTLLPKATTGGLGEDAPKEEAGLNVAAIGVVGGGVALVGAGVVCGVFSLLDAQNVEDRAAQQQLVFPRDQELVDRGAALAVAANVFYGVGAVVTGVGVTWLVLSLPASEEP